MRQVGSFRVHGVRRTELRHKLGGGESAALSTFTVETVTTANRAVLLLNPPLVPLGTKIQ